MAEPAQIETTRPAPACALPQSVIDWLVSQNVPHTALEQHPRLGYARISFRGRTANLAPLGDHSEEATPALMLPLYDTDCEAPSGGPLVVDWLAWSAKTNQLGWLLGKGWAVGDLAWASNPAGSFANGLPIFSHPLSWLQNDRQGICVLHPEAARPYLGRCPRLAVDDPDLAQLLRAALKPPRGPVVNIVKERADA